VFLTVCDYVDLPPRQPSDGYQILDDVHGQPPTGSGTSSDHLQQQQQPGASSTSDSEDSSSEFGKVYASSH